MKHFLFTLALLGLFASCSPKQEESNVCGRVFPERQDDLCWENEYVGFRAYGPATQEKGEKMYGYDLFLKRGTEKPIIERLIEINNNPASWVKVDSLRKLGLNDQADSVIYDLSYHVDHGYGMDCYAVGATLGAGTTAILENDSTIIYPWCYKDVEILENGPSRFQARLFYEPFMLNGDTIREERVITLNSKSNLNHTKVTYHGLTHPSTIVTGIVLHDDSPATIDSLGRYMAYIDPTQGNDNGLLFIGAKFTASSDSIKIAEHNGVRHLLAYNTYSPMQEFEYYWGFGWDKGNIPSFEDWVRLLQTDIK